MYKFNNFISMASLAVTMFLILSVDNISQADLIAFWHFEEPSGSFVADSVNGHHGTATTDVVPSTDRPTLLYGNTRSRSFPGGLSGGGVVVPDHSDLDLTGDFTLEAWIKRSEAASGIIINKHMHKTDDDGSWTFYVYPDVFAMGVLYGGPASIDVYSNPGVLPIGEWAHIALTYDESQDHYDFYLNGGPAGSGTAGFQDLIKNTDQPLFIGSVDGLPTVSFNGNIDEVQIWNEYRTQAQIVGDMAVVPAPGAFLLGSIGLAFSSWRLRKRRTF